MKKSRPPKKNKKGGGQENQNIPSGYCFLPNIIKADCSAPAMAMFYFLQFQWQVVSHCKKNIKWESSDIHLPQLLRSRMTLRRVMNSHAVISPGTDWLLSYLRGIVRAPVSHLLTGASRLPGSCPGSSVPML